MPHLRIHAAQQQQQPGPLSRSFEEVLDALNALPRMFTEPDGSFVWRETTPWDGEVMDAAGRVQYVELRAPVGADAERARTGESLLTLLKCFSDEPRQLLIELVREGGFRLAGDYLDDQRAE